MITGNENQTEGMPSSRIRISHNMTLRQYYAGLAMQGYIAAGSTGMPEPEVIAEYATKAADALINALNKQP